MLRSSISRFGPGLADELDGLPAGGRYRVHLGSSWLTSYVEEFRASERTRVIEVREPSSGRLTGALPLQLQSVRGTRAWSLRRLVPLASGPSDFFDTLALPGRIGDVAEAIARCLWETRLSWDELVLDLIPHSSPYWEPLARALEGRGLVPIIATDRGFFKVDTTGSFDDYHQKKMIVTYSKVRNRMRRDGVEPRLEVVRSGINDTLDGLLHLYHKRRAHKDQRNCFVNSSPMEAFVRKVVGEYEDRGWVVLSLLRNGEDVWAYALDWLRDGVWFGYMMAFDERFKRYSPGKLLLWEQIKRAFESEDIREFNFMRGESGYKSEFAYEREPYVSMTVHNPWSPRLRATQLATRLCEIRDRYCRQARGT